MFSHWLVAVKKYFQPEVVEMASPFSEMFANNEEAEWAFDLLNTNRRSNGCGRCRRSISGLHPEKKLRNDTIRLNYGHWLVHGFAGRSKSLKSMTIAIFQEKVDLPTFYTKAYLTQPGGEPGVFLYTFPINVIRPFEGDIRKSFEDTLRLYCREGARDRKNLHITTEPNPEVAEAVFDLEKRAQLFRKGIVAIKEDEPKGEAQYWKIAPGEGGRLWSQWRDEGYISIGWEELGELSGFSREEFEEQRDEALLAILIGLKKLVSKSGNSSTFKKGIVLLLTEGTSQVLGIGTVVGPYYLVEDVEHGHRIPVRWDDTTLREMSEPGKGGRLSR